MPKDTRPGPSFETFLKISKRDGNLQWMEEKIELLYGVLGDRYTLTEIAVAFPTYIHFMQEMGFKGPPKEMF